MSLSDQTTRIRDLNDAFRKSMPRDIYLTAGVAALTAHSQAEVIRQVKAFQHVRATGEVTPSGWQPGRPTLKPGPALAGKVWKVWQPTE